VCCELLSNIDHPNFGSLPAPFHQEFPGASQKAFSVEFLLEAPRQVFLSASGLWLAVLFTFAIFLVAAMLARYVTSKGEKEQMENVDSAPTAKEAPGIFQTKRRRGRFFWWVCFSTLGRHSHFYCTPNLWNNQKVERTWRFEEFGHVTSRDLGSDHGRHLYST